MEIQVVKNNNVCDFKPETVKSEINEWTTDIEEILDKIRINSNTMCEFHKNNYYNAKGMLKFFKLPTIILSGLSSIFSVGGQPYLDQITISLITCLIGLFIGIINSIELFLAIQTTMENELKISKEFYLLSVDIFKVLMLKRENRGDKGKLYLEEKYNIYCKLVENSVLVNTSIIDKLVPLDLNTIHIPIKRNKLISSSDSSSIFKLIKKTSEEKKLYQSEMKISPIHKSNSDESLNLKVNEVSSERSSPSTENV